MCIYNVCPSIYVHTYQITILLSLASLLGVGPLSLRPDGLPTAPVYKLVTKRTKGGAAGKGVKRPRMTAAEKALLPQGLCSGGCGKQGVVGMKHKKKEGNKRETSGEACGYFR